MENKENLSNQLLKVFSEVKENLGKLSEKFEAFDKKYDENNKDIPRMKEDLTVISHTLWGTKPDKQGGLNHTISDLEKKLEKSEEVNKTKFEGFERIVNQGRGMLTLVSFFALALSIASGIMTIIIFFR
ncbi:hypothetical protein WAF17_02755 [Bernardetia sp. ABR2-2B]|uniref:hypothetical protein n=1 Tax=Bernardetia sp. ABR2-2B TaxID=3127472 RepID=UPI0030CC8CA4